MIHAILLVTNGFCIGSTVSAWLSAYYAPLPPRALVYGTISAGFATVLLILGAVVKP